MELFRIKRVGAENVSQVMEIPSQQELGLLVVDCKWVNFVIKFHNEYDDRLLSNADKKKTLND